MDKGRWGHLPCRSCFLCKENKEDVVIFRALRMQVNLNLSVT
ncbi:hypothetical protein [Parabacteroides merdae]|nr:hypothetical protein [Parabacteroides merdae]MDB8918761.1 hypothetical protein [Parabacteroides merdae]MDB8926923.1 hypothetical protein [Parabacteroides merdae]